MDTWKQQLAASIAGPELLAEHFDIDPAPLRAVAERFPMLITPQTLELIERPGDPIWRQCVPDPREIEGDQLFEDPLNEAAQSPVPAVVHRYPDRALLLVSGHCAGYCRFCTRKSRVGGAALAFSDAQILAGIDYIAERPEIRDVILTGGEPLLLDDDRLLGYLDRLKRLPHLEVLRIGTRVPVTLAARITPALCTELAKFHPLFINTHFNHPRELTPEAAAACARLANAGIPLGNQTVLLKDVNDDAATMVELCRRLLAMRVRPYYLHQMDLAKGTGHFRVPIERGLEIVQGLRGRVSGLAIPFYVIDPPDGRGKRVLTDGCPERQAGPRHIPTAAGRGEVLSMG